jgi:hypothetical protein
LSLDVEEPTSERKIYLEIKQTCKAFYRHEWTMFNQTFWDFEFLELWLSVFILKLIDFQSPCNLFHVPMYKE